MPRYPYWEGSFDGGEFIAAFNLGAGPTVDAVHVTLYGRGTLGATDHFTRLAEITGWQTKFPRF